MRAGGPILGLGLGVLSLLPSPVVAQERCDLRITAPSRSSVGTPGGERAYTTYLGGGTVDLRCGGAVMTGDSAVHHESEGRAEMIGGVDYRDTIRTLSADRLEYDEATSRVVALEDVELVRLATGERLAGPRVSFYRAGAAVGTGRTVATGRPRMTVPSEREGGEQLLIDADEAEFVGDTLAAARGAVEITRPDFDATADSARLRAETARLYGRPVVRARGMRMRGDSIHAVLTPDGLEDLRAFGTARAEGEAMELEADRIVVAWTGEDVERVEAFGSGRALGATAEFIMAADSLDFAFTGGRPDSVTAVGDARSFQLAADRAMDTPLVEPAAEAGDEASWIAGDRIRGWLEEAPRGGGGEAAAATRLRRLLAEGRARSYSSAVRDTAASDRPSRNYLVGETIEITFADGEPADVLAERAIGVYLEPSEGVTEESP